MNKRTLLLLVPLLVALALFLLIRGETGTADASARQRSSGSERNRISSSAEATSGSQPSKGPQRATRSKVRTTSSGLQYEILREGTGDSPGPNDIVAVHYEGRLADGTVFDSSYERGQMTFKLPQVIAGWQEGLQLMQIGGKYRFIIPPELAYGPSGAGSAIPPNSTLTFEIELISVGKVTITESRIEMPVFSTRKIQPEE